MQRERVGRSGARLRMISGHMCYLLMPFSAILMVGAPHCLGYLTIEVSGVTRAELPQSRGGVTSSSTRAVSPSQASLCTEGTPSHYSDTHRGTFFSPYQGTAWAAAGTAPHLHKGEGRPGAEGLILVLQLIAHVLLHALLGVDPLLLVHAEQGPGGHSDGDRILRLGLRRCRRKSLRRHSGALWGRCSRARPSGPSRPAKRHGLGEGQA